MNHEKTPGASPVEMIKLSPEEHDVRFAEIKALRDGLHMDDVELLERSGEYAIELQEKYGRTVCESCELWHFIVGSSVHPDFQSSTFFDFPGDDSIEAFIRKLAAEDQAES